MNSTSLVERPSPMLISIDDWLVGLAAGVLALALASSRVSSVSISERSGTSLWLLNKACGLNSNASYSSNILLNVCSSNILYDNRLAILIHKQVHSVDVLARGVSWE